MVVASSVVHPPSDGFCLFSILIKNNYLLQKLVIIIKHCAFRRISLVFLFLYVIEIIICVRVCVELK